MQRRKQNIVIRIIALFIGRIFAGRIYSVRYISLITHVQKSEQYRCNLLYYVQRNKHIGTVLSGFWAQKMHL